MRSWKYGYNPIVLDETNTDDASAQTPVNFSSRQYWDERYTKSEILFDWLIPARALCNLVTDNLGGPFVQEAEILHIGSGTSDCSALRVLAPDARQIHNVDFSEIAIHSASKREHISLAKNKAPMIDVPDKQQHQKHDSVHDVADDEPGTIYSMQWSCLDLRSIDDTLKLLRHQLNEGRLFELVVDKGTSDSIACGPTMDVQLPYQIQKWARQLNSTNQVAQVNPLQILAVHLAALTVPKTGRWVVVSSSMDRFPFIRQFARTAADGYVPSDLIQGGFPDPRRLWELERKEEILVKEHETLAQLKARLHTGQNRPNPYLYVLRRTDVKVAT